MRNVLSLALALAAVTFASTASAGENKSYVHIINNSPNAVTSIKATATDGTVNEFVKDVPLKGNENATVQFASNTAGKAGCLYTVDVTFDRGEPLTVTDYNACKTRALRVGSALRTAKRLSTN